MSSLDTTSERRIDGSGCGVAWLDSEVATDASVVGAKAANLAVAAGTGLPVLPGFAVTTVATRRLGLGLPPELHAAWATLTEGGERALVVRSSSVVEDGSSSSMAGRFTSVLDVRGWRPFLDAVREVVASGAAVADAPMAVLVQPMLDARAGGVMFGLDPVTGRRDRVVVAAVDGGPDQLVSGVATGSHLVLSRRGRLRSFEGDGPRLTLRARQQLARLAAHTAEVFGGPQDVEWAFDDSGRLRLLQSRPVTAWAGTGSASLVGPRLGPGPVAETLPGVLAELEQDLWVDPLRAGIVEALRLAGGVSRRQLAASPVVAVVDGQVAVDLDLFGLGGRKPFWRKLDPRPGARRLAAAWQVGRLRAATPVLADELLATVDSLLLDVPALESLTAPQLLGLLHRSGDVLVALHGHEVLAGLLLGSEDGASVTGVGAALAALADGRAHGLDDADIVVDDPVVLALLPPRIGGDLRPLADIVPVPPPSPSPADEPAGHREALRLRARWVQELTARAAARLGELLAARGDLPSADVIRHLRLDELEAVIAGRPMPIAAPYRAHATRAGPLPGVFRLSADGAPVAVRGEESGRGAGGGRATGVVVHADGAPPPVGSVLVVRTLDPSLAPHLGRLGGLVAETGSVLSHLAILARESGVPTVVGVDDALRRFPPGSTVSVDGSTGSVEVTA